MMVFILMKKLLYLSIKICTFARIIKHVADENPDAVGAASYPYMELLVLTLYCFMWQRILAAVFEARQNGEGNAD